MRKNKNTKFYNLIENIMSQNNYSVKNILNKFNYEYNKNITFQYWNKIKQGDIPNAKVIYILSEILNINKVALFNLAMEIKLENFKNKLIKNYEKYNKININ